MSEAKRYILLTQDRDEDGEPVYDLDPLEATSMRAALIEAHVRHSAGWHTATVYEVTAEAQATRDFSGDMRDELIAYQEHWGRVCREAARQRLEEHEAQQAATEKATLAALLAKHGLPPGYQP